MTMPNSDYWEKRFLTLEQATTNKTEAYYASVSLLFQKAMEALEGEIAKWYAKFAKSENISYAEAKRLLTSNELKAFKMTLSEYIKKGSSLDPKWLKELERASTRVHISRLEMLEYQLVQLIQELFAEYEGSIDDHLIDIYQYSYYHSAYEIAKGTGVGTTLTTLATDDIKKIISKPWAVDGRDFSERIWSDRTKLVNELHQVMMRGFTTGSGQWKMTEDLVKRMNVSYSNAARLISTETAFVRSTSDAQAFKDTDVEQYKYVATLDRRTSQVCRSLDGKIFDLKDREVGVNAPPMHPRCRSTTVPYFGVTYGMRAARDKDGKTIYVPASMKYQDWYDKFVTD